MTAPLDEMPRERQVASLAGHPEQLDERHLDLGMAVDAIAAAVARARVDEADGAHRDVEQPVVAERPMPGDRRLDQVTDAVQLVAPLEVAVRSPARHLHVAVEVAIGSLSGRDHGDDLVGRAARPGSASAAELPADRLEPLVDVGVEEREDDAEGLAERPIPPGWPAAMRRFARLPTRSSSAKPCGDGALAVRPDAFGPKPAVQRHGAVELSGERTRGRGAGTGSTTITDQERRTTGYSHAPRSIQK